MLHSYATPLARDAIDVEALQYPRILVENSIVTMILPHWGVAVGHS